MSLLRTFLKQFAKRARRDNTPPVTPNPSSQVQRPNDLPGLWAARLLFPQDAERLRKVFQDGPPPSLDSFEHPISNVPTGATLKAWAKLQETERRLAVARWAMWRTEPETGQHRVLAEDLVAAYFYSFEAVVQVLADELGRGWLAGWLMNHPNNSLVLRGTRTIRTLAVHVEDVRSESGVTISVVKGRGGTVSRMWRLPWLTEEAFRSLDRPKLGEHELDAWKEIRGKHTAGALMEQALRDLRQIVFDAEQSKVAP